MTKKLETGPLVYSCSGCSNAGQIAHHVALELDRRGVAEMSCIAGVGGDVPALVKVASSGRTIMVVDGCPLACARSCLRRQGLEPDLYLQLNEYGVKKRQHSDFDAEQADQMVGRAIAMFARRGQSAPAVKSRAPGVAAQSAVPDESIAA